MKLLNVLLWGSLISLSVSINEASASQEEHFELMGKDIDLGGLVIDAGVVEKDTVVLELSYPQESNVYDSRCKISKETILQKKFVGGEDSRAKAFANFGELRARLGRLVSFQKAYIAAGIEVDSKIEVARGKKFDSSNLSACDSIAMAVALAQVRKLTDESEANLILLTPIVRALVLQFLKRRLGPKVITGSTATAFVGFLGCTLESYAWSELGTELDKIMLAGTPHEEHASTGPARVAAMIAMGAKAIGAHWEYMKPRYAKGARMLSAGCIFGTVVGVHLRLVI